MVISSNPAAIKVILDTSVCVAALLSRSGASARILRAILAHHISNILTEFILEEIKCVLRRKKFSLSLDKQETFIRLLTEASGLVKPMDEFRVTRCRDPKDDIFLSLANQTQADYLISLDKDLIEVKKVGVTKIVEPRTFLNQERIP